MAIRTEFRTAGDSALLLYVHAGSADEASGYVRGIMRALHGAPLPGVLDAIPARASLLLLYDPLGTTPEEVRACLSGLASAADAAEPDGEPRLLEVPVLYGGEAGADLARIAEAAGLSEREVVELHSGAEYTVDFLGFMPGFPYLSGLPERLHTPRLETPRTLVPQGSVAIAEHQTAIYPVASPGGWNLIGRTPYRCFDPRKHPPALFEPGDRVRFVPIDDATFSSLHFEMMAGRG
jgi:KipI family sensor histidine kinase inhibitor